MGGLSTWRSRRSELQHRPERRSSATVSGPLSTCPPRRRDRDGPRAQVAEPPGALRPLVVVYVPQRELLRGTDHWGLRPESVDARPARIPARSNARSQGARRNTPVPDGAVASPGHFSAVDLGVRMRCVYGADGPKPTSPPYFPIGEFRLTDGGMIGRFTFLVFRAWGSSLSWPCLHETGAGLGQRTPDVGRDPQPTRLRLDPPR
jgi:hypothetical protein